jgi:LysM repeat protein
MRFGFLIAVLLIAALGCSLSMGGDDNNPRTRLIATLTAQPTLMSGTLQPTSTQLSGTLINQPRGTSFVTPASGSNANCPPPANWIPITVQEGDTLFGIALDVDTTTNDLLTANCLTNADQLTTGQILYVPSLPSGAGNIGQTGPAQGLPQTTCSSRWFFQFRSDQGDSTCPGTVMTANATGQNFEGGRVYVYGPLPGSSDQRNTIYVIYNDHTWETFIDSYQPGQPENDPAMVPPADRVQPVRSIGKLWRENSAVRGKLGWAYAPEQAFSGRVQQPTSNSGAPYFYIDHGAFNVVLRLTDVSNGPNTWVVAGGY